MTIETKLESKRKPIKEKDILKLIDNDFSYSIKERGKEYYDDGNIINCYKSDNTYYAKVEGSSNILYNVSIEYDKDLGYEYDCDCPCTYPCKHEYAVAIAIQNKDYEIRKLKPNVPKKKYKIRDVIKEIPAEDLKKYILSSKFNTYYVFDSENFKTYFYNYFPKQEYDYYYNNLYNKLSLHRDAQYLNVEYLLEVEKYITSKDYNRAFEILKAIINVYSEIELLDDIVDLFPKIGMFLRVIYRKSKKQLKDNINKWIKELEKAEYYNNVYLEDVILTIK